MERVLDFEEWVEQNEEELEIKFAESGADREMGFDLEEELENEYEKYLKENVEPPVIGRELADFLEDVWAEGV